MGIHQPSRARSFQLIFLIKQKGPPSNEHPFLNLEQIQLMAITSIVRIAVATIIPKTAINNRSRLIGLKCK